MPAFQNPQVSAGGYKRKSDVSDPNFANRKRQALDIDDGGSAAGDENAHKESARQDRWMVQWRAPQYKKHKTWDGDAVMEVNGSTCTLYDLEGKLLITGKPHGIEGVHAFAEGVNFTIGGKEIEIERPIPRSEYLSGACFGRSALSASAVKSASSTLTKQFVPLRPKVANAYQTATSAPKECSEKKGITLEAVQLVATEKRHSQKENIRSSYWIANWRKPQQKKHKTWDGDAFVAFQGDKVTLISEKGIILGSKKWDGVPLFTGYKSFVGGKEIELDSEVSRAQLPTIVGTSDEPDPELDYGSPPPPEVKSSFLLQSRQRIVAEGEGSRTNDSPATLKKFISPSSFYGTAATKPKPVGPLHDPKAEGAVVMKAPSKEHMAKHNKKNLPVVDVVVDPILTRRLRPHQVEGVKFMYECVMGLRKHEGNGCILADEMGMGKTLQTITLCWTLLKQNPYADAGPVVGKILIVCPVTLINNWKNEFHKWLGKDRVGIFVGDKDKAAIKRFINSKIHHVLVIGYERLRTVIAELAYCNPPIGLIICDEGHRLKSANNKTSTMFEALRTPRRIILSGTPIQNDLSEFHAMADFCNPGLLDDYNTFRRVYETPILKSRAPECSSKETELGEARSAQLTAIARSFVLRRDATILKKYLPPKYEYVVFVTPTPLQLSIFNKILSADKLDNLVRSSTAESLALINMLTKISNSPILLKATMDQARNKGDQSGDIIKRNAVEEALKLLPERVRAEDVSLSGKLTALANLLKALRAHTDEKCIIVSHYTSTLNILEEYCKKKSYTYHRLDGQTPAQKRQEYVNEFNKAPQAKRFLFLLSSKAGGVGLNLIGASRLCLIDSDWNPSHDLQSMARIHRDGQKRPVFIYRFLTAGTIDEKIYQRQVTKIGLSNSLMGNGTSESKSDSFTRKDLRDIFTVHLGTACHTHDLLECPCSSSDSAAMETSNYDESDGEGDAEGRSDDAGPMNFVMASQVKPEQVEKFDRTYIKRKKAQLAALGEWTHINCLRQNAREAVHDEILANMLYAPESQQQRDTIAKQSRLQSLLDAVDLEKIRAASTPLSVGDVPGGTISFLFERGSKSALDADEDADN
ncbi:hypothetical protein WOLCODRAFT_164492 [Wolfiporia cocos MD-104 SS10]|uniref:Nucleoside triphosphate hydrolase protein n=1 Tax=Wolfiporia cocos (strain MD-104) TaxID=742152 RepID=A0A2H3K390_WOLCO|nr:hypothetical protein WOLCODRAFT_164492 [Wolfiporia cocos MD-104 SS10]